MSLVLLLSNDAPTPGPGPNTRTTPTYNSALQCFAVLSRVGFVLKSESREGVVTFKVKSRVGHKVREC